MTVLLKVDHEKERLHLPQRIRGVYPIETAVLIKAGVTSLVRGTKVNDLNPLWPASHFRDAMLKAAQEWVSQMTKRGYELRSREGDIAVFGPYAPVAWNMAGGMEPHFKGMSVAELYLTDTADMLLYADFLAPRGKIYAEDHEFLAQTFGKEYDRALAASGNDVLGAMLKLPQWEQTRLARQLAVRMVDERERRALAPYGY